MNRHTRLAITNKVQDILKGVGCAEGVAIDIRYTPDEEPTITYKIKEVIRKDVAESEDEK